jgi:hypothetical protein
MCKFSAYIPYFENIKVGLCDHHTVCESVSEPIFMKLGMYIMAPEPIPTAYLVNPPISLCAYMYIPHSW